jgi:putative ATP-dependent endonuclease of OLD family
LAPEVKETYRELRNSTAASAKFDAAIDVLAKSASDEQAAAEMLIRIETIGKGRFAQRLASKVKDQKPPAYIQQAIEHVVRLTGFADAEPQ